MSNTTCYSSHVTDKLRYNVRKEILYQVKHYYRLQSYLPTNEETEISKLVEIEITNVEIYITKTKVILFFSHFFFFFFFQRIWRKHTCVCNWICLHVTLYSLKTQPMLTRRTIYVTSKLDRGRIRMKVLNYAYLLTFVSWCNQLRLLEWLFSPCYLRPITYYSTQSSALSYSLSTNFTGITF